MAREYSAASCIGRDSFQPLMGRESFCELDGGPLKPFCASADNPA